MRFLTSQNWGHKKSQCKTLTFNVAGVPIDRETYVPMHRDMSPKSYRFFDNSIIAFLLFKDFKYFSKFILLFYLQISTQGY